MSQSEEIDGFTEEEDQEILESFFAETRSLGLFRCTWCPEWRPDLPILVSTRPVRPLEDLLVEWRTHSIRAAPDLVRWYLDN